MDSRSAAYDPADPTGAGARPVLFTGTGDSGATALGDRTKTTKTDSRLTARGSCEEVCALLGMALTLATDPPEGMVLLLTRLENDLVDVSADIGAPIDNTDTGQRVRIDEPYLKRLEDACEHFGSDITEPSGVVLPGGTTLAGALHLAHAAARTAERAAHEALAEHDTMNPLTASYLNRLGSLLFILARSANAEHGDVPWHPAMTSQLGEAGLWQPMAESSETTESNETLESSDTTEI